LAQKANGRHYQVSIKCRVLQQEVVMSLYQEVTDEIIEAMENPGLWEKCWKSTLPHNLSSGRDYSGINSLLLWITAQKKGYTSNEWLTYKQAKSMGAQIKKGSKGNRVVYFSKATKKEQDKSGNQTEKEYFFLKKFTVFNREQVEGLEPAPAIEEKQGKEYPEAERLVKASGVRILHGEPSYSSSEDVIRMPGKNDFKSSEHYYSTLFHEIGHWTGHSTRLDRKLGNRFGSHEYAAEELIAELHSAFQSAKCGINSEANHAAYLKSWVSLLKDNNRAIFIAASQASKAADYVAELGREKEHQREHELEL